MYSGMIVSWNGTIMVARKIPNKMLLPGNLIRAKAYAAIAQVSNEITVTSEAM